MFSLLSGSGFVFFYLFCSYSSKAAPSLFSDGPVFSDLQKELEPPEPFVYVDSDPEPSISEPLEVSATTFPYSFPQTSTSTVPSSSQQSSSSAVPSSSSHTCALTVSSTSFQTSDYVPSEEVRCDATDKYTAKQSKAMKEFGLFITDVQGRNDFLNCITNLCTEGTTKAHNHMSKFRNLVSEM